MPVRAAVASTHAVSCVKQAQLDAINAKPRPFLLKQLQAPPSK
jgi:hypothetical protein